MSPADCWPVWLAALTMAAGTAVVIWTSRRAGRDGLAPWCEGLHAHDDVIHSHYGGAVYHQHDRSDLVVLPAL